MLKKRFFKTKDEVDVTFETTIAHDVEGVSVLCDIKDWTPVEMRRVGDAWKARMRLPVDRHVQYRYLASGGWWLNDEAADAYVANEYGTDNSVVDTHRPLAPA